MSGLAGDQRYPCLAKDSIQPVHNNVGPLGLCSILLPYGLVELLKAQLPIGERQQIVGQQPLVSMGVHSQCSFILETKTTF